MADAKKNSRNRQRKTLYASLADKGSRHQESIGETPIIGRFETVTTEPIYRENPENPYEVVPIGERKLKKPYQRIVHDDKKEPARTSQERASQPAKGRKRWRQERAWARCAEVKATGKHRGRGVNCHCCGCPPHEQAEGERA
jgi:hypothetical protein